MLLFRICIIIILRYSLVNILLLNMFGRDWFFVCGNIKVIDIFINIVWVVSKDFRKNKIKVILDMDGLKIFLILV